VVTATENAFSCLPVFQLLYLSADMARL